MSITEHALRNLVAGDLVDAVDGGVREVVNPATGDVIAEVPEGTQADVDRAVAAAKAAFPGWRDTTPGERAHAMLKLADLVEEHGEELCLLESANVGKPMAVAREELPLTPLTALRLGELAAEVLPPGVLNVITGDGEPVGAGLVRHRDVRLVSLTGSVETGKWIARTAADTLKRVHLELGGKAPMVVLDDADPAAVAEGLKLAGFYNSGQDCTAATRILAAPGIHDELLEAIVPAVESITVGDPAESDDLDMGPVVSAEQQTRVLGFLERAQAGGAQVLTGGGSPRERGAFVAPTVLTGVGQRDEIVQQEVFGPVVTVQRFDSDEQAIAWANDVPTGSPRPSGRAMSGARSTRRGCSSSAASGSTTTSRSPRRCRMAASRSRATARTCRSTRSRTTPRSST